jgi:hypothetical protein
VAELVDARRNQRRRIGCLTTVEMIEKCYPPHRARKAKHPSSSETPMKVRFLSNDFTVPQSRDERHEMLTHIDSTMARNHMRGLSALVAIGFTCCWINGGFAADTDQLSQPADGGLDRYFVTPVSDGHADPYGHNGSEMIVEERGASLHIRYDKPHARLAAAGVKEGTLLFAGRRTGNKVEGTAYVFKQNCPPAPYAVSGQFDSRYNLVLNGAAPMWDPHTCALIGSSSATRHARLVFLEAFGDI